tara:strand:+ start:1881 stop:2174 length:294 start_codon:yes stop_codon:yes gene_type:complete
MSKKIILPKISKKILDADFVQLWWSDINSDASWLNLNVAKKSKPTNCVSTGWLIKKTGGIHVIAADLCFEDDGRIADVGNVTTIPTSNVIRIIKIKL